MSILEHTTNSYLQVILIWKRQEESIIDHFMYENNLKCIVKDNCFKNPNNPSSIDLFFTNFSNCVQNPTAVCTDVYDFPKMILRRDQYNFLFSGKSTNKSRPGRSANKKTLWQKNLRKHLFNGNHRVFSLITSAVHAMYNKRC